MRNEQTTRKQQKCLHAYHHAAFINALHPMQKGGMNNKSEMKINCVYHSYNQN